MNSNHFNDSPGTGAEFRVGRAVLALVVVIPVSWVFLYSLIYSFGGVGRFSRGWTTDYWRAAVVDYGLFRNLIYSGVVSLVAVSAAAVVSLLFVFMLREVRNSSFLLAVLCIPMGTPAAVNALIVYQILNPGGLISRLCVRLGLVESPSDFPALVNDRWSMGLVVSLVIGATPLLTMYFFRVWDVARIDRYWQLAAQLGASQRLIRHQIALPMLMRRGWPLLFLMFLIAFGSYEIPYLLGVQSPQMMSVAIQNRSGRFDVTQRPQAFVLATTYFLVAGMGVAGFQKVRRHV